MTNREKDARLHMRLHHRHNIGDDGEHFCRGEHHRSQDCEWNALPLYTTDIAAAFEAESALPKAARESYAAALMSVVGICAAGETMVMVGAFDAWRVLHATAEQRVDAMLAVLEPVTK